MPTLRSLTAERVLEILAGSGLAVDLRPTDAYLAKHVPGSVPLLFEPGPGLGSRARDLLPLDARLVFLEDGTSPLERAADSLRGKGYEVVGYLPGGVDAWPGTPATTPETHLAIAPPTLALLDVADPGTRVAPTYGIAARIPAESLWERAGELDRSRSIGVLAGWGVRAASAVGILEKLGFVDLTFVRTREPGEGPATAEAAVFRVGGPA